MLKLVDNNLRWNFIVYENLVLELFNKFQQFRKHFKNNSEPKLPEPEEFTQLEVEPWTTGEFYLSNLVTFKKITPKLWVLLDRLVTGPLFPYVNFKQVERLL